MSTPNPHDPEAPQVPDSNSDLEPQRQRAGSGAGVLWILLLLIVLALGYWWFSRLDPERLPPAPVVEIPAVVDTETPAPKSATASEPGPASAPGTAGEPAPRRKPDTGARAAPVPRVANRPPLPLASNRQPDYPASALRSGLQGSISVRIDLDQRGMPTDVEIVSRSGQRSRDLDRAVVNAARTWRFQPAIRNGQAVAGSVVVPVEFRRE